MDSVKYCEKHKRSYDVGNCHLCDVENGTGLIGIYAAGFADKNKLTIKEVRNAGPALGEIRSGYRGELRAQYYKVGEMVGGNFKIQWPITTSDDVPVAQVEPEELHPTKRKFRDF